MKTKNSNSESDFLRISFLIPTVITVALLIITPLSTQLLTGIKPSTVSTILQVLVVTLLAFMLYGTVIKRQQSKKQIAELDKILDAQYKLEVSRNNFMSSIVSELKPDVDLITKALANSKELPEQSKKLIAAGIFEITDTIEVFGYVSHLTANKAKPDSNASSLLEIAKGVEGSVSKGSQKIQMFIPETEMTKHREAVDRVLYAVVSNAIEHSDSRYSIIIRFVKGRKGLANQLVVEDKGRGIAKEKLSELFSPLTRVENVREFTHQGRGMSLFVSRMVMRYVGGDLKAESELGKGTKMHIILPKTVNAKKTGKSIDTSSIV